jgi:CheY-like chemotaxis protein
MRLRQIVLNLLGNAFKFTSAGSVELGAALIEERDNLAALRIGVRDTGIGIAPDKLDKLFAPFEQVDASITRRYGGTGLGLAIAGQLIDLMNGQLGVESIPGRGSTFWFTVALPPAGPPGGDGVVGAEVDGDVSESYESIHGTRVLLVEDNIVSQRIVAMMLAQAGCEVTVAGHGEEALDRLTEAEFDVILMDCQMPVMDGLHATRELRWRERGPRTPVIALTADAFEEHRESCLAAGMDGFVRKPVRKASLCRAIAEHLREPLRRGS